MSKFTRFVVTETLEMLPALAFFLVAFHMIAFTETAILDSRHLTPSDSAIATVAALIVAKAILIVEALPVARLFSSRMVYNVLWKTLVFGVVAIALRLAEELIPPLFDGVSVADTLQKMEEEASWLRFWVVQMWLIVLLLVYAFLSDLARAVGSEHIKALLLGSKQEVAN